MKDDRLQSQRFELKYIVPESVALAVRDFVASYLDLDEYGASQPDFSYPVHSLYLDSEAFALHQSTINGDRNRYKLRIRFYENRPNAPVYCEIKRRRDNTIQKERAAVKREALDELLAGRLPDSDDLFYHDSKHLAALHNFVNHVNRLQAKPKVHVSYRREAWLTPVDNSARITMDRNVRSCLDPKATLTPEMEDYVTVFGKSVILELKYTAKFPNWFRDLIQVFNLRQTSAAKYVDGVVLMEENRMIEPDIPVSPSRAVRYERRKARVVKANCGLRRFIPEVNG